MVKLHTDSGRLNIQISVAKQLWPIVTIGGHSGNMPDSSA